MYTYFSRSKLTLVTAGGNKFADFTFFYKTVAKRIAEKLGLIYISKESVLHDAVKHSFMSHRSDFDLTVQSNLMSGPMSMLMADEILAYLRSGHMVPQYMFYRALDLALMIPRYAN